MFTISSPFLHLNFARCVFVCVWLVVASSFVSFENEKEFLLVFFSYFSSFISLKTDIKTNSLFRGQSKIVRGTERKRMEQNQSEALGQTLKLVSNLPLALLNFVIFVLCLRSFHLAFRSHNHRFQRFLFVVKNGQLKYKLNFS